ncbi:MAG: flagellar hook-length control protein FliK [Lachnospiraceae bacterium]|nr:flagellar hook-length control protein FliK [Lachnospiraceae bacterium]
MKLTELFTGEKQIADTSGKHQTGAVQNTSMMKRQIHALVPGQTIQGELIARNGSEVQIRLSEDMVIKARLEQNMNLEVGKTITFEVKNNGQSLLLSPLYANMATDANVLKALDMASLPVTQSTVEMTEQMMQAGLSIDRNSLQQVFRESNMFANTDIKDIVDLHKLSMPVNESNLSQLSSYKNLTHQLVTGLNNCLEVLPDTVQNLLYTGDVAGAEQLYQELLHIVGDTAQEAGNTTAYGNTQLQTVEAQRTQMPIGEGQHPALMQTADGQLMVLIPPAEGQGQVLAFPGDGQLLEALLHPENRLLLQQLAKGDNSQLLQALSGGDNVQLLQVLTQGAENTVTQGEYSQLIQNQEGLTRLMQALSQGGNRQAMQSLLQNNSGNLLQMIAHASNHTIGAQLSPLGGFLKNSVQNMWTLTTEEVAEPKQVEAFYNRLDKHLKSLTQVLENVNQTGSEAYRATANLSQNLDFLQQLNQAYTFIQFPLRLQQGENAHGELFVYTNKKHLAAKDGQISALLHLDMEHLGPVDVYVAMQSEKVNTRFYVQDDEMLDFLSEHMDILTERLNARGYQCNCEMQVRETAEEQPKGTIHEILQAEHFVSVAQYAFDVRT